MNTSRNQACRDARGGATGGSHHLLALNFYTVSAGLSPRCTDLYLRRAHRLRAEEVDDALGRAGRALSGIWRAALDALRRRRIRRQTLAELYRLDDRLLADVGLRRDDIPMVVEGLLASGPRANAGHASEQGRGQAPSPELARAA